LIAAQHDLLRRNNIVIYATVGGAVVLMQDCRLTEKFAR
jgi:hypothetical protein